MTNVHVAADGDLLTIRVDLPTLAKDLSHQVEEWKQTAERTQTQWEQSEWYLGEAKASVARLEEELHALREADDQLEAGHREVTAQLHEAERERDVAQEGLLQGTEFLGAQLARPIEALGRVAWQGPEATVGNVWGCELLDMSPGCREIFERVLASTA